MIEIDRLTELHNAGHRVELHNHAPGRRPGYQWSCRIGIGRLSQAGFIARNDPNVRIFYGETPGDAIAAAYEFALSDRVQKKKLEAGV